MIKRESMNIVALDISGRHAEMGKYHMLCAVVSARITPRNLEKIYLVRQFPRTSEHLDRNVVIDLICSACTGLEGTILAERGDLYNLEEWIVKGMLGRDFRYPRSVGEIMAIELAHHISVAGRDLMMKGLAKTKSDVGSDVGLKELRIL